MFKKFLLSSYLIVWPAFALAVPVTINMTGDNLIGNGGRCFDATCMDGTVWDVLNGGNPLLNDGEWPFSDSIVVDLGAGTHYFAWSVTDSGGPEGLLAEILWEGNANRSGAHWEVFDLATGALIESATELGANNAHPIWGTIAGISNDAQWIWDSNGDGGANSVWIRTSITIRGNNAVPEPGTLSLVAASLLGLSIRRRRNK